MFGAEAWNVTTSSGLTCCLYLVIYFEYGFDIYIAELTSGDYNGSPSGHGNIRALQKSRRAFKSQCGQYFRKSYLISYVL